jgi:glycogen synthase
MTTQNSGLNFTINPNFRPNDHLVLTPPPTLTPYRRVITTPSSLLPVSTQINPEVQLRIDAYRRVATGAYQSAEEIGKKAESFRLFIRDLENPDISNEFFTQSFKQHIGAHLFKKICEEVSQGMTGTRNAETGERLLKENFRSILRIKDYDGRNLLDQIEAYYSYQLENYRGIGELNHLGEILEKHNDLLQRAGRLSITLGTKLYEDAAKLKLDAMKTFQSLPDPAKSAICKKIYELDGGGQKEIDYGYKTALGDIQKLLLHRGASPIKDGSTTCSENAARGPEFITSYLHAENTKFGDSKAAIQEIRKLYELEDLKHFLNDPYKNNDFLVAKYLRLSPDVKKLIDTSIWLASYQPLELGYSENLISRNVRILLNIKSEQGVDIISQLIAHQQEKIKGVRLLGEIESFITASRNKTSFELLVLFNGLSEKAKNDLRERVWRRDGGEKNPQICGWQNFFGEWGFYGTRKIEAEPYTLFLGEPASIALAYLNDLKEKMNKADTALLQDLEIDKTMTKDLMPKDPIDISSSKLEREGQDLIKRLPPNLRVAYVTAELAGVASLGGLASALDGMVRAFGTEDARVVMPLYQGRGSPISDNISRSLKLKQKYEIEVDGKKHRIYSTKVNGIKCYFIDDPDLFVIPPKEDGTAGNFYEDFYKDRYGDKDKDLIAKHRWAVFQSAAAELVYKFSKKNNPVQCVHVHDSQTALIPKFLAVRHPDEWKRGETPATVFTFHNNQEPMVYNREETINILERHGLPKKGANSFMEALMDADMITTVSETYGKEAQTGTFGNGMHDAVKKAALEGKLVGIVNGNSNSWNPTKDEQLRTWKPVLGTTRGDLRFGPDSPDLAEKIKTIQLELCAYLKSLPYGDPAYADLDPEKPIVLYIGRYDWNQKGIDKLDLIMEETLKNGSQFVCVGVEPGGPDSPAYKMLERMKQYAKDRGKKGVLVLEDRKENGKLKYQQGIFGSLLRAACSRPIFPSIYEPCGLVQGELNRFGKKVIATRTGGFVDTLKTEGPDANGYLFKRCANWFSKEQDNEIIATLKVAIADAQAMQHALYHGDANAQKPHIDAMRSIMRNAINSTWEQTPDGSLSAIRRLELAMAKAFQLRKQRDGIFVDLKTVKV